MSRLATILVGLLLLIGIPAVYAQTEPILRLTIQEVSESERDEGWFLHLRQFLGAKTVRPKEGTKLVVQASAYASSPLQTDSTPCLTAAGTSVRPGVVATNFLPLGTLLSINGDVFIVEDRMNSRYAGKYLDIWYPSTSEALEFGRKNVEVEVIGYGKPGQQLSREAKAGAPTVFKRANLRFVAFTKTLSSYLTTKIKGDVNRHDVQCPGVLPIDETE